MAPRSWTARKASSVAAAMVDECVRVGQSARRVPSDEDAVVVRAELRRQAHAAGLRIRTARMTDAVVIVRTDAALWAEPAAVMRQKLTPP